MYFDDRERLQHLEGNFFPRRLNEDDPWIISLSSEKRSAIQKVIGFDHKSAAKLTDEEVEEETLRWVIETDIVSVSNDGGSSSDDIGSEVQGMSERQQTAKYDSIKDLLVASSCESALESLTFLWNAIANALEHGVSTERSSSSQSSQSVVLITFPQSESLWNYDTMVTVLEAIQITQPLLPSQFDLRLDLFHPDFKHSPRMLSPQWHSPFPTVGLTINSKSQPSIDELDIDTIKGKLDVLFQSGHATRDLNQRTGEENLDVLKDCQSWAQKEFGKTKMQSFESGRRHADEQEIEWIVHRGGLPFELYRTVWNSALNLSTDHNDASIIAEPQLDSHTLYRVAVTVNAALKRLDIPVRITQVYHPFITSTGDSESEERPPYGMIQLSPTRLKNS